MCGIGEEVPGDYITIFLRKMCVSDYLANSFPLLEIYKIEHGCFLCNN